MAEAYEGSRKAGHIKDMYCDIYVIMSMLYCARRQKEADKASKQKY